MKTPIHFGLINRLLIALLASAGLQTDVLGAGDFNEDGRVDHLDVAILTDELKAGSDNPTFDMNGDGVVDQSDFDELISQAEIRGDFDGNGVRNAIDVNLLSAAIRSDTYDVRFDLGSWFHAEPDGSVDVNELFIWVELLYKTWFGDANLDGLYESSDLVQVFQFGEYETGEPAGWEMGDWTGDGRFNSSDFVNSF